MKEYKNFEDFEKMLKKRLFYTVRLDGRDCAFLKINDKPDKNYCLGNSNISTCGMDYCTKFISKRQAESFAKKIRRMFSDSGSKYLKKLNVEVVKIMIKYYLCEADK